MSRIKDLKNKECNQLNIIELYQKLINSENTKYVELFDKLNQKQLMDNYPNDLVIKDIKSYIPFLDSEELSTYEVIMLHSITQLCGSNRLVDFNKFIEYNERNLIEKNDISTYKSFEEIENQVNIADIKLFSKELEKQVVTLFNDDEWVVIKPLSFESSKKYGSNTRWCTTMSNDPSYFYKYFRNGILIYCVNKKNGYKVAAYKRLNESDISFWNQEDKRIDSFQTELSGEIIGLLKNEFKNCKKSNYSLCDPNEVKVEMNKNHMSFRDEPVQERRRVPINNAFDGEEEQMGEQEPMEELLEELFVPDEAQEAEENVAMDLGEEIELEAGDEFEEMGRDEVLETANVRNPFQVIHVDDDEMIDVPMNGIADEVVDVHIPIRNPENAVARKIRYVETDDDYPRPEGRTEADNQEIGEWPEEHGIGVVGY